MARMRPLLALALILLALPACRSAGDAGAGPSGTPTDRLTIRTADGPVVLSVEVADTPDERARGLMGRTSLPEGRGMAFVFDRPTDVRFWMKDTLIPLSIAFWDSEDEIVALLEMVPCREDPCPTYDAGVPYVGAVETNRGFFTKHGVAVGDRVELETTDG
jgi:uncharacterized membrane protein (UPF0127 family)